MSPEAIMAEAHKPVVVLISGLKRSGKDYVAKQLSAQLTKPNEVYSFAAPLKDILYKTLDIPFETGELSKNRNDLLAVMSEGYFREVARGICEENMEKIALFPALEETLEYKEIREIRAELGT